MDPDAENIGDARYAFTQRRISAEEAKRRWPESKNRSTSPLPREVKKMEALYPILRAILPPCPVRRHSMGQT